MRTSWIRHVSEGATAHFLSRPQQIPTPSISTARQTPACLWPTARPTSPPPRTLSQSAAPMRVQGHTRAARRRGGSRCSSHSSPRITWRTTGQLCRMCVEYFANGAQLQWKSQKFSKSKFEHLRGEWVDVQIKCKVKILVESRQLTALSNSSNFSSVMTDELMARLGCYDLARLFEVLPF